MREMKDSGIEWIGEIPRDWDTVKIKHLANRESSSFTDGDWIDSPYIVDEGIRYLTSGNIGDGEYKEQGNGHITEETFRSLNCTYAYPGDLVFSRLNTPYGRSCILPDICPEYVLAVDNVILRTDEDKRFISYLTQCAGYHHEVEGKANGTAMKRISRTDLGNISLPVAPKSEQSRIADYLDKKCAEIDALIAAKEKTNALLKERRQSIIYEAVTKSLDPTAPMKDSGIEWIGEIPEGWSVKKLKYVATPRIEKNYNKDSSVPYIGLEHVQSFICKLVDDYSPILNFEGDTLDFHSGDVLFGKLRPYLAKALLAESDGRCSSEYWVLIPSIFPKFLMYTLLSDSFLANVNRSTLGVKMPRAEWGFAGNQVIVVPPDDEQKAIATYLYSKCDEIDSLIHSNESTIEKLKEYRQSVIYEAVTGKVEV